MSSGAAPPSSSPSAPSTFSCRSGCGACCIAPSITAPLPGYPAGKLAGVPCPHLTDDLRCALFGKPERPSVCVGLRPQPEMCGTSRDEALSILERWEVETGTLSSSCYLRSRTSRDRS